MQVSEMMFVIKKTRISGKKGGGKENLNGEITKRK